MIRIFLLTVILYSTLSASGQEAFQLGKTYPVSWIVWYPAQGTYWKAKTGPFMARRTPDSDPNKWESYTYPVVTKSAPTADAPTYARQSTVDSLLNQIRSAQLKNDDLTSRLNLYDAALSGLASSVKGLQLEPDADTVTVTQYGFPLFRKVKDGKYAMRAIVLGSKLAGKLTDTTFVIDIK